MKGEKEEVRHGGSELHGAGAKSVHTATAKPDKPLPPNRTQRWEALTDGTVPLSKCDDECFGREGIITRCIIMRKK